MAISTIGQNGLNAPLSLTTPALGTPSALVLTNATGTPSAINLSNATSLAKAAMPSGGIIQMVEATRTSVLSFTTTYATYTSFISGSITTTVANSKVLVMCNVPVYVSGNGSTWSIAQYYQMLQNGSAIQQFEHNGPNSGTEQASTWQFQYLSGALSVGTYTYSMQGAIVGGAATVFIARNAGGQTKVDLLMLEVAP